MNKNQKKLIEMWFVIISLFVVVGVFEENEVVARSAFIPFVIYFFLNYKKIREIENRATTVKDILLKSKSLYFLSIIYFFIAIVISFYFLFSGKDLGSYINSFWLLMLALGFPLLIPILVSQKLLFKELGKNEL